MSNADASRRSWVSSAQGSGFPIQSLPYGVFSTGDEPARMGVAIGGEILDLAAVAAAGLLEDACPGAEEVFGAGRLNDFLARGRSTWQATRRRLSDLLAEDATPPPAVADALVPRDSATLHLPFEVADYVDFYSSL
ncbi:MAG: fumarylacetoacetase, partial [Acidimicrobiia bacterium]